MITEKDRQAILNGAYGITRNGRKAKYIGTCSSEKYPNYFIFLDEDDEIFYGTKFTNDFREYEDAVSNLDIVSLWKDEPEPFDLDRALAGEPVMTRDGSKGYVFTNLNNIASKEDINCDNYLPLRGVIIYENNGKKLSLETWELNGKTSSNSEEDHYDIIGMWRAPEPVSNTVTLTLPCPLKEPIGHKWYVNSELDTPKCTNTDAYTKTFISKGCYFATKEDAQAWLDAMRNNRR